MNSMQRVLKALSHQEPDRIPLMLLFSHYGAKEMNMSIEAYFESVESVINAQVKMQKKYETDCYYTFFYAGIEIEAWGGDVIFFENGPPNAGSPIIKHTDDIYDLEIPDLNACESIKRVLEVTAGLKKVTGDDIPIIGVVMSPFSVPVMQMGFEAYIRLFYEDKEAFNILMEKNSEFCVKWANAQLEAGATAICFFDPLASSTIIDTKSYIQTGYKVAKEVISKINGPVATHLASGKTETVVDLIFETGSVIIGISSDDDLEKLKEKTTGKISMLGNMNGIDMVNWSEVDTEINVKRIIKSAGQNGGLLIAENHGEIPWQVEEKTLLAISKSIKKWGKYPLDWT